MNPFSPIPPKWARDAIHAYEFGCPKCGADVTESKAVWINRRSPVYTEARKRKWQEFYLCDECETAWWAWSSDRPPTEWSGQYSGDEAADDDPFGF